MELAGRRVLVTGASRGIGEALARRLAERGAVVALVARSGDAIRALAMELGGTAHPADLTDPDQVRSLVGRVEDEAGPIEVLVNNAGIDRVGWIGDTSADDVEELLRINLVTPVELCRQLVPRMVERGGGHLVNISSTAGLGAFPGLVAYSTSKAGLTHFTAGLRADLKGLPVGTTVVELGPVPSDMLDHIDEYPPARAAFRRGYRCGVVADVPRDVVAQEVVEAIEKGRRHVRLPRRMVGFSLLAEAPRRITELLLAGVPAR